MRILNFLSTYVLMIRILLLQVNAIKSYKRKLEKEPL